VIAFVSMLENLVGDHALYFLPNHGRPCATIKDQMCGTYSPRCRAIFQQDDSARQLPRAQFTYIRSISLQPSKLATKSHYGQKIATNSLITKSAPMPSSQYSTCLPRFTSGAIAFRPRLDSLEARKLRTTRYPIKRQGCTDAQTS
jgi:hypothetical protein